MKHERYLINIGFTLAAIMVAYGICNIIINLLLQ
jgi:hypothetical protein